MLPAPTSRGTLMQQFMQVLLSGLATGSIYALAAIGFTLIWQAAQTINFAQGEFVMLPAFLVLIAMGAGLSLPLALIVALIASVFVLGYLFKRVIVDPMITQKNRGGLSLIIATMALAILLKEGVREFYGAEAQPYPELIAGGSWSFFGAVISVTDIVHLAISLLVVVILTLFLDRTRTGRAMQATAQSPEVATILGVDTRRMILYTFLINAALAALASFLITPFYLAKFSNGEYLGLIAFIAAIVGGFNQIRGALLGGLLIGVIDNMTATYLTAEYRAAVPLLLLILIILFKPEGLWGTSEGRSV